MVELLPKGNDELISRILTAQIYRGSRILVPDNLEMPGSQSTTQKLRARARARISIIIGFTHNFKRFELLAVTMRMSRKLLNLLI